MESLEPQVQDSVVTNGAVEASTGCSPAAPPSATTPAISDLPRTADQGKDACVIPHTVASGIVAPVKKFHTVNINKRFLEQNNPLPGASQTPSSSASSKVASATAKSPPPPATSHSRLKLTKLQPSSVGTSPGWTRPSSATPSLAPSPVSSSMSSAPPPAPAPASHGPPQLPHVGKVIQPQPRGVIQAPTSRLESTNGSGKPAWRNVKQGGCAPGSGPPPGVQSEFPTAAEVAQGRLNGVQEKKQSNHDAPATPSSATTEADTFRGVHLDPNTHHWDEMEEDNDDFLGGVIEFGDGRSYQIQPVDVSQTTQDSSSVPAPEISSPDPQSPSAAAGINKEDRFTDDIDRSWPRSAALSSNIRPRVGPPAGASTSSNSSLSPQEASRVLFNERSNRLEPWSSSNRVAPSSDGRIGRDASLHNSVQLLQKQGFDRPREVKRDTTSSQGIEDRRWERGRRASNATTTHSALSGGRDSSRESLRQLPPHLSSMPRSLPPLHTHQLPNAHPPSSRQGSSRERWRQGRSPEQSPVIPSPSDPGSHFASPSTPSALALSPQTLSALPADIDLARKVAMQSAAERARARRQLEEEEREKERARARKKAAELEEKSKSAEKEEKEKEKGEELPIAQEAQPEPASPHNSMESTLDQQPLICPPSLKHPSRSPENGAIVPITGTRSQRETQLVNQPPSASSTVSSWRSNAAPLLPVSPRRSSHSPLLPLVTFPSASQVLGVQLLNPSNDESLEEVEFTDLGKFVGVEPSPDESVVTSPIQQGDVPTEDGQLSSIRPKSDLEPSWRRKAPLAPVEDRPSILLGVTPEAAAESPASRDADTALASPSTSSGLLGMASPAKPFAEGSFASQALVVPPPPPQRSYREPPISTFDDTMSRIKGAMQTNPQRNVVGTERHADRTPASSIAHTTEQSRLGRGFSATARSHPSRIPEPDEPFTTVAELDDNIQRGQSSRIRLPPSRGLEPLSKKELANLKRPIPPLRWEVLSWDPPVEGMSIRDYSVNGVLFPKPPSLKGRPRFFVKLPPRGSYLIRRNSPATPKVHLPVKPLMNKTVATTGAFGRPRVADESSTWRRVLPSIPDQVESAASSEGLVTRSGSSPPDTDKPRNSTPTIETETTQPVQLSTKFRAEPKMPAGAGVAFYRESTSCPSVSFTVSSELEDVRQPGTPARPLPTEHTTPLPSDNSKGNEVGGSNTLLTPREKSESKCSDGSSDTPLTPPSSTGWTKSLVKESPVRKPDPEQLKLLWSQTSEKANVPGVNSLEGIADDLPSVPLTLQEVKSEDGETPPPTGSNGPGSLRMSLHDVTRAFQQVPPPPAGSIPGKASPQSPAVHSTPGSSRHPVFHPHAQPVHTPVGGPTYHQYPSPMLSHSPAPTLMYSHPMAPNPMMGGPSPQYPQPMWIPMPTPAGQTPGGAVRSLTSPYPAPAYLPYPSPGSYPASQPGPQNGAQNRSRPAPPAGLSPNLSHSRAPMYQGSPVLVQPSYPGAMPAGRGVPMQPSHPTPAQHTGGYTPTGHTHYGRPPW